MQIHSFLPDAVRRCLIEDADAPPVPWSRPGRRALLLTDIVGFTALTARYAGTGREGVERLTAAVNQNFDRQIELIVRHGGDVLSFAGDAITASWSGGSTDEGLADACRRACACALELQQAIEADEPETRMPTRTFVAAGHASLVHVGGLDGRWLVFLSGPALGQLLPSTGPGQVAVSRPVR